MKKILLITAGIVLSLFVFHVYFNTLENHTKAYSLEPKDMAVGMNLSSTTYWMPDLPFVDITRSSMQWVTQNARNKPEGKNPWDTHVLDSIPLDMDGYPLYLPVAVEGTEAPQIVATLMCRDIHGDYPAGRYVCLYDGQGEIAFYFDASIIHAEPGRIELDVTPSSDGRGILMKIMRSEKGDHIRNIRVIMPGFETTGETQPFNPKFVDGLRPFKVIRFMCWQRTNDSCEKKWDQRTRRSTYTQAGDHGVAIEYMIELCNLIGADPWFCIPHQADNDYIRQFAMLVKNQLKPERKVYIEYSNEVWNYMFPQYRWVEENGDPSLSHPGKYAQFAGKAFNVWQTGFGDPGGRVIRVVSGQQANPRVIQGAIDHLGPGGMDALATSAYFGLGKAGYEELRVLGARAEAADVMRLVMHYMRVHEIPVMKKHADIASKYNLEYLTYEAGQSVCPSPLGSSPAYRQALWDVQKSPDMYLAYREFMQACRDMNIGLFMAFSYVTAQETKYGSWGHLAYLGQPLCEAPKYRALLDEINREYPVKE
ncbi:MAG: hypothetical protein JXM72_00745 [Deltaproteobacteria bacterium]|nr:hypothetical protein [Deltaproteobacteria bacterium]